VRRVVARLGILYGREMYCNHCRAGPRIALVTSSQITAVLDENGKSDDGQIRFLSRKDKIIVPCLDVYAENGH
jgi:hypothetical protein